MAKELVAHALTDFREPKRHWPEGDLKAARLDVLDWMFRTHLTGGDHMIPIDEFMFLIDLIELRANRVISIARLSARNANLVSPNSIQAASTAASLAKMQVAEEKSKRTLSLIAMIRKHYDGSDDKTSGNVVQLCYQKDPD
ncbi:hypothetical protein [Paracoccus marcusii]|uniref:Uncharacterized protein n=1 Tax=Paracoccus marcusii TaxID=59779 RepID=A0ABY7UU82_9RHOB|nr:hypothetical protein [Paracoccus marcusii]WDA13439.1 hypothetical protein PRL19_04080 [Paracoccus marcusii]